MKYYSMTYSSPIGKITAVTDGDALIGLWIEGQKHFLEGLDEIPTQDKSHSVLRKTAEWLDAYFAGEKPEADSLRLKPQGNGFRQCVWQILKEIPYGKTVTYGDVAKEVAKRMGRNNMSAQAVGSAVGHNPISIIIPCHRVLGKGGNLTGYDGGLDKKLFLLQHEEE